MRVSQGLLFLILVTLLVSHGGGAPETGTADTTTEQTFHVGKAFCHCTKLAKDNYAIWLAGIITVIMSYQHVKGMSNVLQIVTSFKEHCTERIDEIEITLRAWFRSQNPSDTQHGRK